MQQTDGFITDAHLLFLKQWDRENMLLNELRKLEPRAWVTYFPVEGFYLCSYWDTNGKYCSIPVENTDRQVALLTQ